MAIDVDCSCGVKLKAPEHRAGMRSKCPNCGQKILVPQALDRLADPTQAASPLERTNITTDHGIQSLVPPTSSSTAASNQSKNIALTWMAVVACGAVLFLFGLSAFIALAIGASNSFLLGYNTSEKTANDEIAAAEKLQGNDGKQQLAERVTQKETKKNGFVETEQLAALEKRAIQGSAKSQTKLGKYYYYAKGIKKDIFLAKNWFEKASRQNYGEAHYLLAQMHKKGQGGFKASEEKYISCLKKAVACDFAPALAKLKEHLQAEKALSGEALKNRVVLSTQNEWYNKQKWKEDDSVFYFRNGDFVERKVVRGAEGEYNDTALTLSFVAQMFLVFVE